MFWGGGRRMVVNQCPKRAEKSYSHTKHFGNKLLLLRSVKQTEQVEGRIKEMTKPHTLTHTRLCLFLFFSSGRFNNFQLSQKEKPAAIDFFPAKRFKHDWAPSLHHAHEGCAPARQASSTRRQVVLRIVCYNLPDETLHRLSTRFRRPSLFHQKVASNFGKKSLLESVIVIIKSRFQISFFGHVEMSGGVHRIPGGARPHAPVRFSLSLVDWLAQIICSLSWVDYERESLN